MLTRFVRIQLILFTLAGMIGAGVMIFGYMQAPTLLGIGHITVKLELPAAGGLYRFSNVTYRGIQVGTVTDVRVVGGKRVEATLSLTTSQRIPADLIAEVRSMSAVGEQYVDLLPHSESAPYLADGSVIAMGDTRIPQPVGPMLDQLHNLVQTIPGDKLTTLLDESFLAFDNAGYDFGSLLDSSRTLTRDFNGVAEQTRMLIDDSGPLLDTQAQNTEAIRTWVRSLAGFTDQLNENEPQLRTVLRDGPGAVDEVSRLLNDLKPTLPVLLANLTTIGQIGVTYNPSIEQLLVLLPPYVAATQSVAPMNNATGIAMGDFSITIADPPSCTVGFLPPSAWRNPDDTAVIDTPDGLYCKLPQDSPIAVRGARNYPCMEHPGKRAPTVQLCDSEMGFVPLTQRQHALGPYPLDPNLIAAGIPPDSRVNPDARIYGPLAGTPLPPNTVPPPPIAPVVNPPGTYAPPERNAALPDFPPAAPSSFAGSESGSQPGVAIAKYDSRTGAYMAPDGHLYRQSDLVAPAPKAWTDMMMAPI